MLRIGFDVPPLRGSKTCWGRSPTADAVGYYCAAAPRLTTCKVRQRIIAVAVVVPLPLPFICILHFEFCIPERSEDVWVCCLTF